LAQFGTPDWLAADRISGANTVDVDDDVGVAVAEALGVPLAAGVVPGGVGWLAAGDPP
jgi:hypothetical protein